MGLFNFLTKDIAIDLGTANTLIIHNDKVVVDEPSIVAVDRMTGQVIAVGDPWLYNEYVDGRKLPVNFQNFEAMQQVVGWALANSKK